MTYVEISNNSQLPEAKLLNSLIKRNQSFNDLQKTWKEKAEIQTMAKKVSVWSSDCRPGY